MSTPYIRWCFVVIASFMCLENGDSYCDDRSKVLDEISQHFATSASSIREVSFEFSKSSFEQNQPGVLFIQYDTRIARKNEKLFSNRIVADKYASKVPPGMTHSGMSYNGKDTYYLMSVTAGMIYPGDKTDKVPNYDEFLGFQGYPSAGFQILLPQSNNREVVSHIAALLKSERFSTADVTESGDLISLTVPGERLTFDRSKHFALTKREVSDVDIDHPLHVSSISDFFELAPSVWLGKRIDIEWYPPSGAAPPETAVFTQKGGGSQQVVINQPGGGAQKGNPGSQAVIAVQSPFRQTVRIELNGAATTSVPDSAFEFAFPSQTQVVDYRTNMAPVDAAPNPAKPLLGYRVPSNPADLDRVIADAKSKVIVNEKSAKVATSARSWILVVNVVCVLIVLAIVGYYRWTKA